MKTEGELKDEILRLNGLLQQAHDATHRIHLRVTIDALEWVLE